MRAVETREIHIICPTHFLRKSYGFRGMYLGVYSPAFIYSKVTVASRTRSVIRRGVKKKSLLTLD